MLNVLPQPFDQLGQSTVLACHTPMGANLFRQDDESRAIFFVHQGALRLIRHTASGFAIPLHTAKAGEIIAEASLFSNVYHCDCVALSDCRVSVLDKAAMLERLETDGRFALAVTERLALQVQTYRRRIEIQSIRSATDRVRSALADGWLTGSISDFAAEISLTREATYRALSALVRSGEVEKHSRGNYRIKKKSE